MSKGELEKVVDFSIENQNGRIEFLGFTDLTGVDLSEVVTIEERSVDLYEKMKDQATKPKLGQKLNKPATITLFRMVPRRNMSVGELEQKLKNDIKKNGAEWLSYD